MVDPVEFCKRYLGPRAGIDPAKGEPAPQMHGVLYQARWEQEGHGLCDHARRTARALAEQDVPLLLRSTSRPFSGGHAYVENDARNEVEPWLVPSFSSFAVRIHHLETMPNAIFSLGHEPFVPEEVAERINRRRIFYGVWERYGISEQEAKVLNSLGQVWTACRENATMLEDFGVDEKRIRVVPVPHWPDDPLLSFRGSDRYAGVPRFYNIGKWEPRKATHELIGAFFREFVPGEAKLYLKTTPYGPKLDDYPASAHHSISQWLEDEIVIAQGWTLEHAQKWVRLIDEFISRSLILRLHRQNDVYVCSSHGEGWDLPAYEAKLAGNLMVYTACFGPEHYAGPEDLFVRPSCRCSPHPWYGWDGSWTDYRIEDLQSAMRRAWNKVREGWSDLRDMSRFSALNVGAEMKAYVEELVGEPTW